MGADTDMAATVETRINMSPEISSFLNTTLKSRHIDSMLKTKLRICLGSGESSFAYDILSEAHAYYCQFCVNEGEEGHVTLHELVKTSQVFNKTIPPPVRSPQLQQRLDKLKKEQEQKEYNKMVNNVVSSKKLTLGREIGTALRTTKQQTMSIVNFLLSIVAAYAFGYVVSQYAFPNYGARIIFSIFMAIVVGLADLYFMSRYEI